MNNEELIKEIENLKKENETLKNSLIETQEHLKKYTAPTRSKTYYENHKEEVIQKVKEYKKKNNYVYVASQEQKKEWARTAYLKKKEKLKKINEIKENENI